MKCVLAAYLQYTTYTWRTYSKCTVTADVHSSWLTCYKFELFILLLKCMILLPNSLQLSLQGGRLVVTISQTATSSGDRRQLVVVGNSLQDNSWHTVRLAIQSYMIAIHDWGEWKARPSCERVSNNEHARLKTPVEEPCKWAWIIKHPADQSSLINQLFEKPANSAAIKC